MKTKLVKNIKKTLGFLSVLAGVGLSVLTLAYLESSKRLAAVEQQAQLTSVMVEAAQYHVLLGHLNRGDVGQARTFLASALKYDLADVKTLTAACSETHTKEFAQLFSGRLAHDDSKNYLASNQRGSFDSTTVVPVIAH